MAFNQFGFRLLVRVFLLSAVLVLLTYLVSASGYPAASLICLLVMLVLFVDLLRFVARTNHELSRFLEAARYADFNQKFELNTLGTGFQELGETFNGIMTRFREDRSHQEQELRHLKALVEHVPIPLISISGDELTVWNNAARRMLGFSEGGHLSDLSEFGDSFVAALIQLPPGQKQLIPYMADDHEQTLMVVASEVIVAGKQEKVLSLQNIQQELDGSQLQAWQDLVRVLTHEILNSITPIASLARTSANLIRESEITADHEEFKDIQDAIETVARRSDGLMNFVGSYRRLTRLPPPQRSKVRVSQLLTDVLRVVAVDWEDKNISLVNRIEPESLELFADESLLEQILINIMQNAEQALESQSDKQVMVTAGFNRRGRATIDVEDSGPGVNTDMVSRIFVPFFTTKREGTGVGLALARQVMIAHGGAIVVSKSGLGGAKFSLIF